MNELLCTVIAEMNLEKSEIIATVASGISLLSLFVALFGYFVSRKALRMSEQDFEEKRYSVQAYLIDSFNFKSEHKKYCTFAISFTNKSSSPRSFSRLELEVEFVDDEGILGKAYSVPDETKSPLGLNAEYQKLNTPINMAPKETISGWVTFPLPMSSHRKFRIKSYKVSGKTLDGHEASVESFLMRFVEDEKES